MRRGQMNHGQMDHGMSGFGKTLAGSVIFHAALLAAAAFLYTGANRVFITPVYTVDLMSGPAGQKANAPAAPVQDEARSEPAAPVEKPRAVEKQQKAQPLQAPKEALKIKEKPPIEEALRKIEKKVEQRKNEALVETSIDELKKKMEASRVSKERLSKLREELVSRASSPPAPAPARPKPAQAASNAQGGGAARPSLEERYSAYYGVLRDKVQENWIYPQGLKDNRISIIVSMRIARDGKLLDASVEKSSGNKAFDDSLLKAIRKAAPFPPLPVDLEGSFLETGLRFCPGCVQ